MDKYMKVKLILILSIFTCCVKGLAFCSIQNELSFIERKIDLFESDADGKSHTSRIAKEIIITNLKYLEDYALRTIDENEKRIVKYKDRFCEQNADYILKKIKTAEKKIKNHEEILFSIQLLKLRIAA
jgi:hypothetical protein